MLLGDGDQLSGHDWGWIAVLLTGVAGVISAVVAAVNKFLPIRGQERRKQMALEARLQSEARDAAKNEWRELVDAQQRRVDTLESANKVLTERLEKMYADVRALHTAHAECLVNNEKLTSRVVVIEAVLKRTQDQLAVRNIGTSSDAILVTDQYGTIRQWNEAATVLFHWLAHEAVGMHIHAIVPPEGREAHNRRWLEVMQGQTDETVRRGPYTVELINKAGERFKADVLLSAWMDENRRYVTASIRKSIVDRKGRTLSEMPNPIHAAITDAAKEIVEAVSSTRLSRAGEAQAPAQPQAPKKPEDAVDLG
jgi:PAS domain S-box-containing protein